MILSTKEDFEKAVLNGEEIKHSTIFYIGELKQTVSEQPKIGDYNKDLGVFAGYLHKKEVWVSLHDEPEQMTWKQATEWAEKNNKNIPTIDELTVAYLHKDEINAALEANGGEPFKEDDWYWSSSEFSTGGSWALGMGSGYRNDYDEYGNFYVRVFQLV